MTALAETTEYPSQGSYENGALMCTSAAVFWALSCVCNIVQPVCSAAQMRLLMQTAAATHAAVARRGGASADHTLQQHEVLLNIDKPCSVQTEEMYGYCGDKTPEMEAFVHVSDLYTLLQPGNALLLTGAGHTTALFRDARRDLYAFDSVPACVARVPSAAALAAALLASHKGMLQFTATRLCHTAP
jgi:hypothetical protein